MESSSDLIQSLTNAQHFLCFWLA